MGLPGYRKENLRVLMNNYSALHLLVLTLQCMHRIARRSVRMLQNDSNQRSWGIWIPTGRHVTKQYNHTATHEALQTPWTLDSSQIVAQCNPAKAHEFVLETRDCRRRRSGAKPVISTFTRNPASSNSPTMHTTTTSPNILSHLPPHKPNHGLTPRNNSHPLHRTDGPRHSPAPQSTQLQHHHQCQ